MRGSFRTLQQQAQLASEALVLTSTRVGSAKSDVEEEVETGEQVQVQAKGGNKANTYAQKWS